VRVAFSLLSPRGRRESVGINAMPAGAGTAEAVKSPRQHVARNPSGVRIWAIAASAPNSELEARSHSSHGLNYADRIGAKSLPNKGSDDLLGIIRCSA